MTMKMSGGCPSWMRIRQAAGPHERSASLSRSILGFDFGTGRRRLAWGVAVAAMVVGLLWTGKMALDNEISKLIDNVGVQ